MQRRDNQVIYSGRSVKCGSQRPLPDHWFKWWDASDPWSIERLLRWLCSQQVETTTRTPNEVDTIKYDGRLESVNNPFFRLHRHRTPIQWWSCTARRPTRSVVLGQGNKVFVKEALHTNNCPDPFKGRFIHQSSQTMVTTTIQSVV